MSSELENFEEEFPKDGDTLMSWHYLPVYTETDYLYPGEETPEIIREYSLCEVYMDKEDKLDGWTVNPAMTPSGETAEELKNCLNNMLNDVNRWEPVKFDDLQAGMVFEPRQQTQSVESNDETVSEVVEDVRPERSEHEQRLVNRTLSNQVGVLAQSEMILDSLGYTKQSAALRKVIDEIVFELKDVPLDELGF